jgi:glutamate 5-kinase
MMLSSYKRITLKIGSSLLVDSKTGLKRQWLAAMAADISKLRDKGAAVSVVSSGAIALGRSVLGLGTRILRLEESQAAAAAGQILLARAWDEALSTHNVKTGQILLTLGDTEERRRYLNARATIGTLLKLGAVPIINENDTVATSEIRYGDNDRLAARVATMMGGDLLVLLSDIDGLYTAPPTSDANAKHIAFVPVITPEIEAMAGGAASILSRGGMRTKIDAGKIATAAGTAMMIVNGKADGPLAALNSGAKSTLFAPSDKPERAYKTWIAGHLEPQGKLTLDQGAVAALQSGKSLLPAGVRKVEGEFSRGDTVAILDPEGVEIARGLAAYDSGDAVKIAGKRTQDISALIGYDARSAMVHRDDLVISRATANIDKASGI